MNGRRQWRGDLVCPKDGDEVYLERPDSTVLLCQQCGTEYKFPVVGGELEEVPR